MPLTPAHVGVSPCPGFHLILGFYCTYIGSYGSFTARYRHNIIARLSVSLTI